MVTTISSINVIKSAPSTSFTFLPDDRLEVESQKEAGGRSTLISFTNAGSKSVFQGIVGEDSSGNPMLEPTDLIAKPCPPFCGEKKHVYAVAYP